MFKIFKIKEGKENQWRNWSTYLNSHRDDVIETLKEERLTREKCILIGDHIIYITSGEESPSTDRPINVEHRKQLEECLESTKGETLFDFSA